MAKTNPYSSRQSTALAFDEEQAEGFARPAAPGQRVSARTRTGSAAQARLIAEDDEEAADALPRRRRKAPEGAWASARGAIRADYSRANQSRWPGFLFRTRIGLALLVLGLAAIAALLVLGVLAARRFLESDARFRITSSSSIQLASAVPAGQQSTSQTGTAISQVTREELLSVFGADIGRNIFFVPLARRQAELEQIPWVAQASVLRLLPDQIRVSIVERSPVAFVRLGNRVELVDAHGVILHLAPSTLAERHYSFPVVTGLDPNAPPPVREARMLLYQRFVDELDGAAPAAAEAKTTTSREVNPGSVPISSQLSEVDLTDPEDVRALVPAQGSDILLHFGNSDFLARYHSYQAHLAEWRQQYPHLSAIDLRYDRQVVLKMADGAESEASSVDHGNALVAASPSAAPPPPHRSGHAGTLRRPAYRPAGHGTAHGWRPQ